MKRIVKDIFDIKEGETFYLDDGTKFRVAFNNKELERFIAVCEECENKNKIGKQVEAFNFDGLNVRFTTDYINKVVDINGKEVETERTEKEEDKLEKLVRGINILMELDNNPDDKELQKKAYEYAKEGTLELLKKDNVSLEDKKEIMDNFKRFKETYKELNKEDEEVTDFINELEEE